MVPGRLMSGLLPLWGLSPDAAFAASGNMAVNNQMGWKRSKRFNEVQALMREIFYAGLDHVGRQRG